MQPELVTWPFIMSFVWKDITQNNAIIGMLSLNNAKDITIEYDYVVIYKVYLKDVGGT